jgi:enoyl-CoA hydratase
MKLAAHLAAKAPIATRYILELVHEGADMPFDNAQYLETALFGAIASTEDTREGTRAFLEKRKAEWKAR